MPDLERSPNPVAMSSGARTLGKATDRKIITIEIPVRTGFCPTFYYQDCTSDVGEDDGETGDGADWEGYKVGDWTYRWETERGARRAARKFFSDHFEGDWELVDESDATD